MNDKLKQVIADNRHKIAAELYKAIWNAAIEHANTPISDKSDMEEKYILRIYNTHDNKTVDIIQDGDKIVLTHQQSIDLANEILTSIKVKK